ncbi:MAG: mannose-6-phosphate isomerase [Pseudonocardiales bacterium]|nr:mannose-6-phosphate isomerase [Pseudonocardiales bacterium]
MPAPYLIPIEGVARHYAWGSPTAIPALLGWAGDGRPLAELWFGAHADAPSPAPDQGSSLDELIAAEPVAVLGARTVERFGPRLPFLVKLLTAETALSIQVHPTREQAQAGFAAEEQRGVPRDAPERNYRDTNHKPELLCALTPFEALCGFRPVDATLALLDELAVPELAQLRAALAGPDGLRAAFTALLTVEDPAPVVAAVIERAAADEVAAGPAVADALAVVRLLAGDFPGDIGIVLSLLLNHVALAPGEAVFLDAGNVHCYLRGLGVEVMANSDNVLRCALTPKHVDVAEVLAVTDFRPLADPVCRPVTDGADGAAARYDVPVDDFAVSRFEAPVALPHSDGPILLVCTDGAPTVTRGAARAELRPGAAVFAPHGAAPMAMTATGRVWAVRART